MLIKCQKKCGKLVKILLKNRQNKLILVELRYERTFTLEFNQTSKRERRR